MRRGQIASGVGRTIRYIKGLQAAGHDCLAIKMVGRTANFGEKSIKKEAYGGKRMEMPSAVICKRCASIDRVPPHFRMEQRIDEAPLCKLSLETQRRRRPKRKRTIKRLLKLRDSIKPSEILDFTKKQVVDIINATIKTMKEVGQGTVHEADEQSVASSSTNPFVKTGIAKSRTTAPTIKSALTAPKLASVTTTTAKRSRISNEVQM